MLLILFGVLSIPLLSLILLITELLFLFFIEEILGVGN
jgi:hypothetical protein